MKFLKNKINVVISLLVVVMIVLILFSSQREKKSGIEGLVGDTLSPIQKIVYTISKSISDTYRGFTMYSELVGKVEKLSEENGYLRAQIKTYEKLHEENENLRSILNFKDTLSDYDFIGTNIIGKSGMYPNNYIVDIGTNDGIKNGMVVIANGGLFGMVTSVSNSWSLVSPIINGDTLVSGIVQRTNGNQGIVKGSGDTKGDQNLKMEYLPINEDILPGDTVVTSGLGGVYPANIPIGEVISVKDDERTLSKSVYIKSHVDFNFVKELFIVLSKDGSGVGY